MIRLDFNNKRRKQGGFRSLYSKFGIRTPLEDILDAWKDLHPEEMVFKQYKDTLRLRNWLAHGRYFSKNLGRKSYSIDYIYALGIKIQTILD